MNSPTTIVSLLLSTLGLVGIGRADALRDPMRPPVAQVRTVARIEPAPVLSAVLSFNGERTAIFNGRLVRTGSQVGAYTIEAVNRDGVRYRHAGSVHDLHLAHSAPILKLSAADTPRTP